MGKAAVTCGFCDRMRGREERDEISDVGFPFWLTAVMALDGLLPTGTCDVGKIYTRLPLGKYQCYCPLSDILIVEYTLSIVTNFPHTTLRLSAMC